MKDARRPGRRGARPEPIQQASRRRGHRRGSTSRPRWVRRRQPRRRQHRPLPAATGGSSTHQGAPQPRDRRVPRLILPRPASSRKGSRPIGIEERAVSASNKQLFTSAAQSIVTCDSPLGVATCETCCPIMDAGDRYTAVVRALGVLQVHITQLPGHIRPRALWDLARRLHVWERSQMRSSSPRRAS